MIFEVPDNIFHRLQQESIGLNLNPKDHLVNILDKVLPSVENFDKTYIHEGVKKIQQFLNAIPCIPWTSISEEGEAFWWLKFGIKIESKMSWIVVQELGHILNYLSAEEKLPTTFYPVSPPPYMNGGPAEFLSWVIEPTIAYLDSNVIYDYLQGRLPEHPNKEESWLMEP